MRSGLFLHAVGSHGQLGVPVHLATRNQLICSGSAVSEVWVDVLPSHEVLGRSSVELRHLVAGRAEEAQPDADVSAARRSIRRGDSVRSPY